MIEPHPHKYRTNVLFVQIESTSLEKAQDAFQAGVGLLDSSLPVVPANLLALALRRIRVGVAPIEQVPHVEMRMPSATRVHINVQQLWNPIVIERPDKVHLKPRLLAGLTQCGCPRRLTWVDVPSRLQPETEPLVLQQHHTARPHHQGRTGDVDRVRFLRKRFVELIKRLDEGAQ